MEAEQRSGTRIKDRPEFASKPKPLTMLEEASVATAVAAMCDRNYGSVIVIDGGDKVIGVMTERDIMRKIVDGKRDPQTTTVGDVMTRNPRMASEDDDVVNWLRIMSNERFRRLPIVDRDGRIKAVFTQGDFVSYTWPDLMYQARQMGRATLSRNFPVVLIGGGIMFYTLLMIVVLAWVI